MCRIIGGLLSQTRVPPFHPSNCSFCNCSRSTIQAPNHAPLQGVETVDSDMLDLYDLPLEVRRLPPFILCFTGLLQPRICFCVGCHFSFYVAKVWSLLLHSIASTLLTSWPGVNCGGAVQVARSADVQDRGLSKKRQAPPQEVPMPKRQASAVVKAEELPVLPQTAAGQIKPAASGMAPFFPASPTHMQQGASLPKRKILIESVYDQRETGSEPDCFNEDLEDKMDHGHAGRRERIEGVSALSHNGSRGAIDGGEGTSGGDAEMEMYTPVIPPGMQTSAPTPQARSFPLILRTIPSLSGILQTLVIKVIASVSGCNIVPAGKSSGPDASARGINPCEHQ